MLGPRLYPAPFCGPEPPSRWGVWSVLGRSPKTSSSRWGQFLGLTSAPTSTFRGHVHGRVIARKKVLQSSWELQGVLQPMAPCYLESRGAWRIQLGSGAVNSFSAPDSLVEMQPALRAASYPRNNGTQYAGVPWWGAPFTDLPDSPTARITRAPSGFTGFHGHHFATRLQICARSGFELIRSSVETLKQAVQVGRKSYGVLLFPPNR